MSGTHVDGAAAFIFQRRVFGLLCGISGLCVLAFETIWIRALSVTVGSMVVSATLVVCAFFFFAALGNGIGGWLAAKVSHPLAGYALFEAAFGIVSVACYLGRDVILRQVAPGPDAGLLARRLIEVASVAGIPLLLSGMSFPFLVEAFVRDGGHRTGEGGGFYGMNLLGAAAGVILGGVFLPFLLGYRLTVIVVAAVGLGGAAAAWIIGGRCERPHQTGTKAPTQASGLPQGLAGWGWVVAVMSGMLSIGIESLMFQYFRLLGTGSIYSMSAVLVAFLAGLGAGALLAARLRRSGVSAMAALSGGLWVAGVCWVAFPHLMRWLVREGWVRLPIASVSGMAGMMLGESLLVLLLPATACGLVFPMAWDLAWRGAPHQGGAVGRLVMLNKLAAAVGAVLAPFALVPRLGLPGAMAACGCVYLAMGALTDALACWRRGIRLRGAVWRIALVAGGAGCLAWLPASPVIPDAGQSVKALYQGAGGIAAVVEDSAGSRHVVLDQNYLLNGTGPAMRSERHESWIPLFLHGAAKNVVFIGMASGISAAAGLDFPLEHLTALEIVPEVARAAREHFEPWSGRLFTDPRARVIVEDGRVAMDGIALADVVIMDLFLPGQEGTADLYSRDFFVNVRGRLAAGGLFCLWIPSYQHDAELSSILARTFAEVFSNAILVRGNLNPLQPVLGLVGSRDRIDWSDAGIARRLELPAVKAMAGQSAFLCSVSNARMLLLGDLRAINGQLDPAPVTTDDRPVFAFRGAKPLRPGTLLRGTTLLDFYGRRFLEAAYPSLDLGGTSASQVLRHVRAGNYAFAAAVAAAPLPGTTPAGQLVRNGQAAKHLEMVAELAPGVVLTAGDLGR